MSEKLSGEEVSKRVLAILQSSDFTKTLESFSGEKLKPTMNIMAKKINKAKKKLKRLQKRQRKQDGQGVVSVNDVINAPVITERFDISEMPPLIKKVGEVILDGVKDIYGNSCVIKPV